MAHTRLPKLLPRPHWYVSCGTNTLSGSSDQDVAEYFHHLNRTESGHNQQAPPNMCASLSSAPVARETSLPHRIITNNFSFTTGSLAPIRLSSQYTCMCMDRRRLHPSVSLKPTMPGITEHKVPEPGVLDHNPLLRVLSNLLALQPSNIPRSSAL
jgi:hypothetical protein